MAVGDDLYANQNDLEQLIGAQAVSILVLQKRLAAAQQDNNYREMMQEKQLKMQPIPSTDPSMVYKEQPKKAKGESNSRSLLVSILIGV